MVWGFLSCPANASAQACTECEASVVRSVELVIPEAQGGIGRTPLDFAIDGSGTVWVLFPGEPPALFDADGVFLERYGSIGQGPGDFRNPVTVFAVPGDSVAIVDGGNRRVTIVGPNRVVGRTVRMSYSITRAVVVSWPDSVFVSGAILTPAHAGWPLHLADLGGSEVRVFHSFGANRGLMSGGLTETLELGRRLATAGREIWTVDEYRLRARRWSPAGEMQEERAANLDWFGDPLSLASTMPEAVNGLYYDAEKDLLWLVVSDVDREVLRSIFEEARASGRQEIAASQLPPGSSYRVTHLVALDSESRVYADLRLDGYAVSVGSDGTLLMARTGLLDVVRLFLEAVEVTRPGR